MASGADATYGLAAAAGYRILREVVQNTSPLVEQNSEKT